MDCLLVITGPTGVGKTELTLRLVERFGCPIVSADSRQIYREIPIGTAAPTAEEQERIKHYFVGTKSVKEEYSAGMYERECLEQLSVIRNQQPAGDSPFAILTGGSMLYIDAVCKGFDDIPAIKPAVREAVRKGYAEQGLGWLQAETERLDKAYWDVVDRQNPQRLMHCVEVSLSAGKPYSTFRKQAQTKRDFAIVKVALERPREELYDRINRRVDMMLAAGLEDEARAVYPLRHLNSLQTVGYRELFDYFDGKTTREEAIRLIKQNSRHYAKRQMTWFRADRTIHWLNADLNYEEQMDIISRWLRADGVYKE
jgi:tRNA dimethylallyltransferase